VVEDDVEDEFVMRKKTTLEEKIEIKKNLKNNLKGMYKKFKKGEEV